MVKDPCIHDEEGQNAALTSNLGLALSLVRTEYVPFPILYHELQAPRITYTDQIKWATNRIRIKKSTYLCFFADRRLLCSGKLNWNVKCFIAVQNMLAIFVIKTKANDNDGINILDRLLDNFLSPVSL